MAVLLATTALAAPALALAQLPGASAPARAPAPTQVNRIVVQGNERIETSTVLSYLPIRIGTSVTDEQIAQTVQILFQTGLFSNANITIDAAGVMTVQVEENPIINRVIFEGEKVLDEDKLRDEVQATPRGIFTVSRIEQDVQRMIELYRREGRISATVTPKYVELPQKRVDVIFEIDEGPKSGILDVNFLGNTVFSDQDLQKIILTQPSAWYKFLATNANYDPDRVDYDVSQLREYYRNHGYFDFKVESSVAELRLNRNAFVLTFTLNEGKQFHFGKISVTSDLNRLDSAVLQRLLPIKTGQLYQDQAIEAAQNALVFSAGQAGFAFVDVVPDYTRNDDGTVDVVFRITEGPRVYVERIDIIGNTTTLDRVIRREMELVEGDKYNQVLMDRSLNKIKGLGFFSDTKLERLPGSAPDRAVVRVAVAEQPTGQLALTAGYSSVDQLVVDFNVTQANFRGRGENLSMQIRTGSFQSIANLGFTEPRLFGRNLTGGFQVYAFRYDFTREANYSTSQIGGTLNLGFPLSSEASVNLRYSLRMDDLNVLALTCNLTDTAICQQLGTKLTSSIGATWQLQRAGPDYRKPTRGYNLQFDQDVAGIGGDSKYVRSEFVAKWYHGFTPQIIFSAKAAGGYVDGYGGNDLRISDRFFRGGQTFRGFETAGIGPRDTTFNSALGGKIYGLGTFELTVPPVWPPQFGIDATLFTDFGTLGGIDARDKLKCNGASPQSCVPNSAIKDDFAVRATYGVSIGWKSPLGPVQFDISRILNQAPYDRTETFQFTTRRSF
ncbi:MAG: outer membrane protein assembly factor BamA [Alphaproteobacteria bacterium]